MWSSVKVKVVRTDVWSYYIKPPSHLQRFLEETREEGVEERRKDEPTAEVQQATDRVNLSTVLRPFGKV